jgi:3-methylcrotonyl-CoA carboxylase alpha subunit
VLQSHSAGGKDELPPQVLALERLRDGATQVRTTCANWRFTAQLLGPDRFAVTVDDVRHVLAVHRAGQRYAVFSASAQALLSEKDPVALQADTASEGGRLSAPMPGKVVAYLAAVGASVKRGQPLAVMEAMKMEHTISAPHDGVVQEHLYAPGDQVAEGGELLRLRAGA